METQLKKGLLDVVVLAALQKQDSYGYRIVQSVSEVVQISESTLYPILKRLEQGGMLSAYSVEHSGRLRKYYRITQIGRDRVSDFLSEVTQMERVYRFIKEGEVPFVEQGGRV